MELEGPQQKQLQAALISAFPTQQDLEQMVFHGLDVHLSAITAEGTLSHMVFELLRWAQAQGRLEELIKAALAHNSGNPELQRVAALLGVGSGQSSSGIPAPTLPRIWNIPYPRNPFFTGREAVLMQLAEVLKAGQTAALSQPQAITGLGGIGKTQIALEYAYQHRQKYEAVFWVLADTHESLVSRYFAIAQLLKLPEKDEQDQQVIIGAVKTWLQTHGSWLLILDNADELVVAREFIPPTFGGHILLTTGAQSMGRLAKRVEVETMPIDIGALFLLRRAGLIGSEALLSDASAPDVSAAKTICEQLGGLPLALDQAGAYIEETACSVANYLACYRKQRGVLLARRGGLVDDHPGSVAATWSLSFEKVEQQSQAAAKLLRLCAFLAPDAIPEEIITQGGGHLDSSLALVTEDDAALDKAIAPLLAYSLIHRNRETKTLSMHRLVQAVLKDAMDEESQKQWAQRSIMAVQATLPVVEHHNRFQWQRLIEQVQVCACYLKENESGVREAIWGLEQAGRYLTICARYREAQALLEQAYEMSEREQGAEHLGTASVVKSIADLSRARGKYRQAEQWYMRALSIYEEQVPRSCDTARCLSDLAGLYEIQEKYLQAEQRYRKALSIYEEQLGQSHPDTARCLNGLATISRIQRKYDEAEVLYLQVISICKQHLGEDHPHTAASRNDLALLYQVQRKYAEAEVLYLQVVSVCEQQLGETHPLTAQSLHNLALFYQACGKYEKAESLHGLALYIREQQLGDHPDTARSLSDLAQLYKKQRRDTQAKQLQRRALLICEQQLGQTHPLTHLVRRRNASLLRRWWVFWGFCLVMGMYNIFSLLDASGFLACFLLVMLLVAVIIYVGKRYVSGLWRSDKNLVQMVR